MSEFYASDSDFDGDTTPFDKAELYCIGDPDNLSYESPEEAIEYWVIDNNDPDEVRVDAYNHVEVDPEKHARAHMYRTFQREVEAGRVT